MTDQTNTGYENIGDGNTGDDNRGNRNSGDQNFGDWNSGDCNVGNGNTGHDNTGHDNAGDHNTGHRNGGDSNSGDHNTGDGGLRSFCTNDGGYYMFNKTCTEEEYRNQHFPRWLYFSRTKFISSADMTDKEKMENPSYKITGGYLQEFGYFEAAKRSWDLSSEYDRALTQKLVNFDDKIFKELFGFSTYDNEVSK